MNLVLFTAISPLLESVCLDSIRLHDTVIVDTDDSIHARLKEIGISSIALRSPGEKDWETRDKAFRELAMPGTQLDKPFFGTSLPMWKVLSIDRLNFWYRGRNARMMYESIMALDWNKAYVPLDINHCLPFALARHSGREVVGVQVNSLKTREWLDLLISGTFPFRSAIVSGITEKGFLEKYGIQTQVRDFPDPSPQITTPEERNNLRKGLRIDGIVALVLFDSITEWEFRQSLPFLIGNYSRIFVYPVHGYDSANLHKLGIGGKIVQVGDLSIEAACDEVVIFRYDANLLKNRRVPVRIVDVTGRWLTAELSQ